MSVEKYVGGGVFASFNWNRMELTLRAPCRGGDHEITLDMDVMKEIDAYLLALQRLHLKRMEERARDESNIVAFDGKLRH